MKKICLIPVLFCIAATIVVPVGQDFDLLPGRAGDSVSVTSLSNIGPSYGPDTTNTWIVPKSSLYNSSTNSTNFIISFIAYTTNSFSSTNTFSVMIFTNGVTALYSNTFTYIYTTPVSTSLNTYSFTNTITNVFNNTNLCYGMINYHRNSNSWFIAGKTLIR